jgi:hypothetical protein
VSAISLFLDIRTRLNCLTRSRQVSRTPPSGGGGPPRFLPAPRRHGPAPFRAFVRWKVTRRDRAVASGRQAGRQRSSDRGIASESHGWRRIRGHGRGSGPRLEPSRERNGTRRDRTRAPQRRRARRRREIAGAPRREWRGSPGPAAAISPRRAEPRGRHGHASEAEQLKTVGARRAAPTPTKRSR